jgi:Transposase IS116/IS110/IS902 family
MPKTLEPKTDEDIVVDEVVFALRKAVRQDREGARKLLSRAQLRFLVDFYYGLQDFRIQSQGQQRAGIEQEEPHLSSRILQKSLAALEDYIRDVLDDQTDREPTLVGQWVKQVRGIGPVLSAGLLAYIDIRRAPTVGHIWSYGGLDPARKWLSREQAERLVKERVNGRVAESDVREIARFLGRDEASLLNMALFQGRDKPPLKAPTSTSLARALARRPWNAKFKVLLWKIGQSFVKVSGSEGSLYGRLYRERKELEIERNEALLFVDQAKQALREANYGADTVARAYYEKGMLPPARIQQRAERYATKLFLSHLHHEMYLAHYGTPPPLPYVITVLGHAHVLEPEVPFRQTR